MSDICDTCDISVVTVGHHVISDVASDTYDFPYLHPVLLRLLRPTMCRMQYDRVGGSKSINLFYSFYFCNSTFKFKRIIHFLVGGRWFCGHRLSYSIHVTYASTASTMYSRSTRTYLYLYLCQFLSVMETVTKVSKNYKWKEDVSVSHVYMQSVMSVHCSQSFGFKFQVLVWIMFR